MTSVEMKFFVVALVSCSLATAGYLLSLVVKKVRLAKISTWILAAGFIGLTLNLFWGGIHSEGWSSFGSRYFLSIYAWVIACIYLGLQFRTKTRTLGAFIAPCILMFLIAAAGQETDKNLVPPQWQGWLTSLHLALAIAGEGLFVLASAAGAMFLIQNRLLKHKKPGPLGRLLPSLGDLDRINHLGLLWGFPLLTVGIIGGVIYAVFVWGGQWLADPKVLWSLAIWMVNGFLLHQRLAIGWKGSRMAALSFAGLIVFLCSALLIRFCLATVHDFI
ncbi:MAG TPA: cytochrome c biogenesis protein CcsA [Smithellaceae bacterium]|nr:cytochrome c biogenesis protein CcsA [Smithellaceae bacterium]